MEIRPIAATSGLLDWEIDQRGRSGSARIGTEARAGIDPRSGVSEAERTAAMEIRSGISPMANTKRLGFVARLGCLALNYSFAGLASWLCGLAAPLFFLFFF